MKIAIRADGGSTIGMGHIMRTLVLAEELAKDNEVFYVCKIDKKIKNLSSEAIPLHLVSSKYAKGIEKVLSSSFRVVYINEDKVIDELKNVNADLLITDSYDVDEKYFDATKAIFNKTAYVDDLNKYFYNVDYILNQNCGAEDLNYSISEKTVKMTGLKYVMLRKEFRSVGTKNITSHIKDIMITVGGSDPYGITERILVYIGDMNCNLHVVIGPSFEDTDFIKRYKKNNIYFYENADMFSIMQHCDLAISGCGSTLYELAACGVPTLGIVLADNQKFAAEALEKKGSLVNLGYYNILSKVLLQKQIDNLSSSSLRSAMSQKGQVLIDGKGVYRVTEILTGRESGSN